MKPYCEIMVTGILSSIRSDIVNTLMKKYSYNQSEVSKLLGVSQPSVSQYIRNKRGRTIINDADVRKAIDNLCFMIAEKKIKPKEINREFCSICGIVRKKGLVCRLHKNAYSLQDCKLCASDKL